ncbi:uncharacterized protein LOC126410171 [Nymphaea colorata]|uniref:uncharacterized protein LOC126410171 n=1 Tax=Nymphaea colorata TaxID=210225 RepID=UPI00214E25FA|nr:uncharacterized protein LOC126410171 [Nymphaea colorata]
MDDSSSGLPALRKRPDDGGAGGSPPEKKPCIEPVPEDLLRDCDDLGEEPLPCFAFEEALVSEVMKELEETIKGSTRSATTTRMEDLSGPLVSVAGSSVMASVDVGHAPELFYAATIGLRPTFLDGGNPGASFVEPASVCSDGWRGEGGHGEAATSKLDEEKEKEEEEWLTRVLSGPSLDFEQGFLGL